MNSRVIHLLFLSAALLLAQVPAQALTDQERDAAIAQLQSSLHALQQTVQTQQATITQLQAQAAQKPAPADAYIAPLGEALNPAALELTRDLRRAGLRIELGDGSFRLKKSFEFGNKLARKIVLLGEDELQSGILTVKDFATGEQVKVPRAELAQSLTA